MPLEAPNYPGRRNRYDVEIRKFVWSAYVAAQEASQPLTLTSLSIPPCDRNPQYRSAFPFPYGQTGFQPHPSPNNIETQNSCLENQNQSQKKQQQNKKKTRERRIAIAMSAMQALAPLPCGCYIPPLWQGRATISASSASRGYILRTQFQSIRRDAGPGGGVTVAATSGEEVMEGISNSSSSSSRRSSSSYGESSFVEVERRDAGVPSVLYSVAPLFALAEAAGYSQASYYTSLGLFLLSLPGVWSLVKRATKSKIVKKTFSVPGATSGQGKSPKQIAGEITSFFTRSNFNVASRGDTVTFEGVMTASRGQAAFLTFCTLVSLASAGLVLSIASPDIGEKAYYITLLSPLAGVYYWRRATRTEQIQVKIVVADDETSSDVTVQGDDEQIDRMRRELGYMEKGMVYVKGILEQ